MMRISKEPMTVDQLRRYVDPRFRTIRKEIRGLKRDVGGLKRDVGRLKRDVGGLKRDVGGLKRDFAEMKREQRSLRNDVHQAAVETRRHFDIVAESLRSEIRLIAEAVDGHSQRFDNHETRIRRLEQLP
jgi:chromosome segregation ATPase